MTSVTNLNSSSSPRYLTPTESSKKKTRQPFKSKIPRAHSFSIIKTSTAPHTSTKQITARQLSSIKSCSGLGTLCKTSRKKNFLQKISEKQPKEATSKTQQTKKIIQTTVVQVLKTPVHLPTQSAACSKNKIDKSSIDTTPQKARPSRKKTSRDESRGIVRVHLLSPSSPLSRQTPRLLADSLQTHSKGLRTPNSSNTSLIQNIEDTCRLVHNILASHPQTKTNKNCNS